MKIFNKTTDEVLYEIRSGEPRMVLSSCDLSPEEEESWQLPHALRLVDPACALRVWRGDERIEIEVSASDEIHIKTDNAGMLVLEIAD